MVMLSKKDYDRSIKYTELIILVLFALSAILMSLSQDKLMKSTEITLTNIKNFETTLLSKQIATDAMIYHLTACSTLELTNYVPGPYSSEFLDLVEQAKNECVKDSLEQARNSSMVALESLNLTRSYENITKDQSSDYKKESERLSKFAFWIFLAGVLLCFLLVLDLIIFEPKE
jgi:hypothetical protein